MTALDALLPGPRQRPDAASKTAGPDTAAHDAATREAPAADTPFGKELGRLERPQGRGQKAADQPVEDIVVSDAPVEPETPVPVLDPQAALRALFGAAQEPGTPIAPPQPTTTASVPANTDLVALAERAANSATLLTLSPGERPKLAVLGQETHFAPVLPGEPRSTGPVAQMSTASAITPPNPATPLTTAPSATTVDTLPAASVAMAAAPAQAAPAGGAPRPAGPTTSAPRSAGPERAPKPGTDAPAPADVPAPASAPRTATLADKPAPEDLSRREPGAAPQESASVEAPVTSALQAGLPVTTLRHLAETIAAEAPATNPAAEPAKLGQAQEGPLRILTIQLQPADLGTVTVRMRLQEGRLEIGMETGRHDTAELLRRDGGTLTDLLRGAGYQADLVAIRADGTDLTGGQPGGGQGNGQSPPQQGSGQGATAQNQPQGQQGQQNRNPTSFTDGGANGGSNPGTPERRPTPRAEPALAREERHDAPPGERDRGGVYL